MSELDFCIICSKTLRECKCTEEDQLKNYHKIRVKTFGAEQVLIEVCTYISIIAKRIEKLEKLND